MSFQDKIWYLWSYYKVYLILFLAAAVLLSVRANAFYNTAFTPRLGIALINNHSPTPQNTELWRMLIFPRTAHTWPSSNPLHVQNQPFR